MVNNGARNHTERRTSTAVTVAWFIIRLAAKGKQGTLSPKFDIRQRSQSIDFSGSVAAAIWLLSIKTKTTEKNMTSIIMMRTIAMPLH